MTTPASTATEAPEPAAPAGHAAHTRSADRVGLPGVMPRPVNLTFLGAGSNFCSTLCRDLLLVPNNAGGELRLVDVDEGRLGRMHRVIETLIQDTGQAGRWSVRSGADRRALLPGTHYAVCCVEVSGVDCVAWDNDIPLSHGVDQCIGDTLGPGGLFKALRTVPVFLDILRDMRELCPGAPMLNYTNPMGVMCLAAGRAVPEVPVVGLCHSVQGTSHHLAKLAGVPHEELRFECAGINHLAWFTKLEHRGEDLYARSLRAAFEADVAEGLREAEAGVAVCDDRDVRGDADQPYAGRDLVRKDMCLRFGAFITESSGHLSEYLPGYRSTDEGRKLLRRGYDGGSRFYASNWPRWRAEADRHREKLVSGEEKLELTRSWEYGTFIVEAIEKDSPWRIHGNVMNHPRGPAGRGEGGKLIGNLPADGCVEVSCLVDGNGVQPTRSGALPPQMAHVCASNMAFIDLAATAVSRKSKEAAVHALLLDPLTSAVLPPTKIREMAMEMFEAEEAFLPGYA